MSISLIILMHLKAIPDAKWKRHCESNRATRWYGLPGAFAKGDTIHVKASVLAAAKRCDGWQRKLLVHEVHHILGNLPDHPNSPIGGIKEAISYGFDTRSFTRFLRWNSHPKDHEYWVALEVAIA